MSVGGLTFPDHSAIIDRMIGAWAVPILHFLVSSAAVAAAFIYLKYRAALNGFDQEIQDSPFRLWIFALHLALFGGLLESAQKLYRSASGPNGDGWAVAFLVCAIAVFASGLSMVARARAWMRFARATGAVWGYSAVAGLAATLTADGWRLFWRPASALTFRLVQIILRPIVGTLVVDPATMLVGTRRFTAIVTPQCSGLEGIGLLVLFSIVWLWLYRKECRFPQALLLLPAGVVALFLLNSVRIAALVLIGDAGARQMAINGFHSEAGWIAFNGVALGLCVAAGRVPWFMRHETKAREQPGSVNMVAVYVGPFLAILAAGMLARALTGGFEWLYPLRLFAAGAVFWAYRREYRAIKWRCTWRGPVIGLFVFAIWLAFEWARAGSPQSTMPLALQTASGLHRWGWVALRTIGAAAAVPLGEELAFRGYLMRRLVAEQLETISPMSAPIWAIAVSSVLFGAMHGAQWIEATIAGALYALVYVRKGQLGEAVAAHAVTNSLIAASVLGLSYWRLW
ncbi:MAG: exosortase E/protease, VPEID-CTERM system [Bryobacteraceae bacterium]